MNNILKEIEEKYPVDTILVNGEQIWPYLRIAYYFEHIQKIASQRGEKRLVPPLPKRVLKVVKNSSYGLRNWFGKYDYIALSDTTERKSINGKYFNRLLDPIIDELGRHRVLYLETPAPSLYPANKVHTKNVVCGDLLRLTGATWARVIPKGCLIHNGSILEAIQGEYGLKIDDVRMVRYFDSQRRVFSLLFRRIRPKALLVSCYYGYIPAVKAAKDLGIEVIEVQHGVIGKEHPAYNVHRDLDRSCFPDHLLVFGKRELSTFDSSCFADRANVHPVGSFYIDHIRASCRPEPHLSELISGYRRVVGATLQWTLERRLIAFICEAATLDSGILYMLIPRRPEEKAYSNMDLPRNVTVIPGKNFYELMTYCDFHSTVNSTCALEAPSLGVQNILINIDNLSNGYYGTVLNDGRVTRFVDTPEEFVSTANSFEKLERDTIAKLNEDIIATGYSENIQRFVATHLPS